MRAETFVKFNGKLRNEKELTFNGLIVKWLHLRERNLTMIRFRKSALLTALITLSVGLVGCGRSEAPSGLAKDKSSASKARAATKAIPVQTVSAVHDHSSWWCTEHGVPEEVCALCNAKLAAEFQKKKDWCKEHDRPASQCFTCHPELESRFAAQFEAKYGKKPPKPSLN